MDIRKVKKLIELLEESGIAEIEIHEGEESIRISRASTVAPVMAAPMPTMQAPETVQPEPAGLEPEEETDRAPDKIPYGRHLLPRPFARQQDICGGGSAGGQGRYPLHY